MESSRGLGLDTRFGRLLASRNTIARRVRRIAVLTGSISEEDRLYHKLTHPDSLSVHDIVEALDTIGVQDVAVVDVALEAKLSRALWQTDLAIINLHGEPGEDGSIQGFLDVAGVPYVGSRVEASVIALNKSYFALVMTANGIPIPPTAELVIDDMFTATCDVDVVVKPTRGGSSIGVRTVKAGVAFALKPCEVVQEFLQGVEATVTIVEDGEGNPVPLRAVALEHGMGIFTTAAKISLPSEMRIRGTRPSSLLEALSECENLAVRAHQAIHARHISRSDFILTKDGPILLEINTQPGLSSVSLCAECARHSSLTYEDFMAIVVMAAV